ncbi:hypothetical protein ACI8AV_00755 [Geodermatophilus sp. SYSU D00804]
MPWWVWALVVWVVLAAALAVILGKVIRAADRRESKDEGSVRDDEEVPPGGHRAS